MTLDERDAGSSIEIGSGDVFAVRLKENASTGYRWAIDSATGLETGNDRTEAGAAPGGAGLREFQFRALQPGNFELRLKNWREWQGDAGVIDRFVVHVRVAPAA